MVCFCQWFSYCNEYEVNIHFEFLLQFLFKIDGVNYILSFGIYLLQQLD